MRIVWMLTAALLVACGCSPQAAAPGDAQEPDGGVVQRLAAENQMLTEKLEAANGEVMRARLSHMAAEQDLRAQLDRAKAENDKQAAKVTALEKDLVEANRQITTLQQAMSDLQKRLATAPPATQGSR